MSHLVEDVAMREDTAKITAPNNNPTRTRFFLVAEQSLVECDDRGWFYFENAQEFRGHLVKAQLAVPHRERPWEQRLVWQWGLVYIRNGHKLPTEVQAEATRLLLISVNNAVGALLKRE